MSPNKLVSPNKLASPHELAFSLKQEAAEFRSEVDNKVLLRRQAYINRFLVIKTVCAPAVAQARHEVMCTGGNAS